MRTHTEEFKNKIKEAGRQIDSIITYEGGKLLASDIKNVKPILNSEFLKSVMKGLNFDSYKELDEGLVIHYEFGLFVNTKYEYLDYGNYIIYSKELNEDTGIWTYKCYDKMVKTMVDYEPLEVTYPITLRDFLIAFANKFGLIFKNANEEFPNYDKVIPQDLWWTNDDESLGYSYRDVLDDFAGATASNIIINNDDEFELKFITDTNDKIDKHYLKDINVKFGKKVGPFNCIALRRSADSDNIYYPSILPENPLPIVIRDNQIMNDNNRDTFMKDIYDKLNGLEYYVNDYSSTGILYYEVGDLYEIEIDDNTYKCLMLNDEPTIQGGISENIFTNELEEDTIDFSKADDTDKKIAEVYLYVDKQDKEIIGRISDVEGNYTELKETVDGLEGDIKNTSDDLITLQNNFELTAEGFEMALKKSGNNLLMGTEFYDLTQWGWLDYYILYEGATAPDTDDYKYWYDTNNDIVYQSTNGSWIITDKKRKELDDKYQVQSANIVDNEETNTHLLAKKGLNFGSTSSTIVTLDTTQDYVALSFKAKQNISGTVFRLEIWETNYLNPSLKQSNAMLLTYANEYEVDEDLKEYTITVPITKDSMLVNATANLSVPTNPSNLDYWLDLNQTTYGLKQYVDNEWVEVKETKILYITNSSTSELVNKYLIPYITENKIMYFLRPDDVVDYKDFTARSLWIQWRAYNQNDETYEIVDNACMIGDIKLEYGKTSTTWANNYNEVYGKNYKMDNYGFSIKKGDYKLFLDEDELTGYYKDTTVFQLNQYRTYSKVGQFEETDQNGLITKKLSNGIYVRYIQ